MLSNNQILANIPYISFKLWSRLNTETLKRK